MRVELELNVSITPIISSNKPKLPWIPCAVRPGGRFVTVETVRGNLRPRRWWRRYSNLQLVTMGLPTSAIIWLARHRLTAGW